MSGAVFELADYLRCEKNKEGFESSYWPNLLMQLRPPQKLAKVGQCEECQQEVKPLVTNGETFGKIYMLPRTCDNCCSKHDAKHALDEKIEAFNKRKLYCSRYQNKLVEHQGEYVGLGDVSEGYRFQDELVEHVMGVYGNELKQGAYIYGPPGSGKTFWVKVLNNSLVERFRDVCYIRAVDLAVTLRKECRYDQYKSVLDQFSRVPVLIIDDFGTQKNTEWVSETMFSILDERYSNNRTTIMTSNLPVTELGQDSVRLISRLSDSKWINQIYVRGTDVRLTSLTRI